MANVSAYARKLGLDFLLNAVTATRPATWYLGVSVGVPTSVSDSEHARTNGYSRATMAFGAAVSPAGTINPSAAVSFAAATYSATLSGWQIWDAATAGNMLAFGTLSAATRPSSLSAFTFNSVSVKITAL